MKVFGFLFVLVLGTLLAPAQNRIVNATGFAFVDSVSSTDVTTITLGQTVEWHWTGGASHTVTSGIDGSDPNAGQLFNSPLNSFTTIFTFTPLSPGTYPYYCVPHVFFGMTGTLIVLPPTTYPGSNEDYELGSAVNVTGQPIQSPTYYQPFDVKVAQGGNFLTLHARSPNGTFDFTPLLLVAQVFPTGMPPLGQLPGLRVNAQGGILLLNGLDFSSLAPINPPGGVVYGVAIPVNLSNISVMFQALAIAGYSNNGFFAISNAHEIQIQ